MKWQGLLQYLSKHFKPRILEQWWYVRFQALNLYPGLTKLLLSKSMRHPCKNHMLFVLFVCLFVCEKTFVVSETLIWDMCYENYSAESYHSMFWIFDFLYILASLNPHAPGGGRGEPLVPDCFLSDVRRSITNCSRNEGPNVKSI